MAKTPTRLDAAGHALVSDAVARAENTTAGEIVTIVTRQSDSYADIALAWSASLSFLALLLLSWFPDGILAWIDGLTGTWANHWTAQEVLTVATGAGVLLFLVTTAVQLSAAVRLWLVPGAIKSARTRARAVTCFKVGAERRTHGRTGILIYLSLGEHRAEIVADESIAGKLDPAVWGDAMAAMLVELKAGRTAEGMIAAVRKVGALLAAHLPSDAEDTNELPDRLIEV